MQKDAKIAAAITLTAVSLLLILLVVRQQQDSGAANVQVVHMDHGVQVIDLTAKGGFYPNQIDAKAGVPTELHVATNNTYDCSSELVIPSLDYEKALQPTGTEIVSIAPDKAQGTLKGQCGMGMYNFEINFL